jgi:hypothetical protein
MPASSDPNSATLKPPVPDSEVGHDLLRQPSGQSAAPMADKSAASARNGRIRAIAVIIGALLLVVALLTIVLPPPAAPTGAATAPANAAANTAAPSPAEATNAPAAITSTVQPTSAAEIAPTALTTDTQAGAIAEAATPEPTPNISETHPAAEAVRAINDELLDFYQGKATTEDLKKHWTGRAYQAVTAFAYTTLRRTLTVDLTQNDPLEVTLRYIQRPALVRDNGNTVQVKTREYWGYTNPSTKRAICETRDYTYTMVKLENDYQVRDLTSSPVSTRCEE